MSCNSNCSNINIPIGPQGATGPQGPAGQNGTNGTDGTTILHSDYTNSTTTGTTLQVLKTYSLVANQLSQVGDGVTINTQYTITNPANQTLYIYFNGSPIALASVIPVNYEKVLFETHIVRISANQVDIQSKIIFVTNFLDVHRMNVTNVITAGGLNFAGTLDIETRGDSVVTGDIVNNYFEVKYYKA